MRHLFFKPTISPLQAIAQNGFVVNSDEHRLISLEKDFLGVKTCVQYSNDPKIKFPYNAKDVFVLNHEESHELGELLYYSLTRKNGQVFEYFQTDNMDWAAFLFKGQLYSLSEFMTYINTFETTDLFQSEQKVAVEQNAIFRDLNIVIGVNNGYDANNGTTFYVLIEHRKYYKGSFLTIDNFKFSHRDITDYFISGKQLDSLKPVIGYEAAGKFVYSIIDFAQNYDFLHGYQFSNIDKEFIPICLDIHNINRSVTSMENDKRLQGNAHRLVEKANNFLRHLGGRKDYALLIDFLLSYSEFDLDEIRNNRNKVEELFVSRRSYKSLITRLTKTLPQPTQHGKYLKDQIDSFDKIKHLI